MKRSKFAVTAIVLFALSVSTWASDKMKASIHIFEAVTVGSTQLAPGDYTMKWTETGSDTEVTFAMGKRIIATVPAQVTQGRSGYDNAVVETDGRSTLTGIALPTQSFSFTAKREITDN